MVDLANGLKVATRLVVAVERIADAAMIAARAYEFAVMEDMGYKPFVEEDED